MCLHGAECQTLVFEVSHNLLDASSYFIPHHPFISEKSEANETVKQMSNSDTNTAPI